jgi:hypothetical protein
MANLPPDVQEILKKQVGKATRVDFEKDVRRKFEVIKTQMITEFIAHPVTKELIDGPTASNISNTLSGTSNLFAFIGFDEGDNPIEPILKRLELMTVIFAGEIPMGSKYVINIPTAQEIFDITPMPWAKGRSWAQGIEKGISGLGYLLRINDAKSRSGAAIQSRVKVRDGGFKNTQYISALINKYSKRFQTLT